MDQNSSSEVGALGHREVSFLLWKRKFHCCFYLHFCHCFCCYY